MKKKKQKNINMSDENRKSDNCGYNCLICAAVI